MNGGIMTNDLAEAMLLLCALRPAMTRDQVKRFEVLREKVEQETIELTAKGRAIRKWL